MFGENFTIEGLMEDDVYTGDHNQIGSATVVATQPRMPYYKLGVRFGHMDMVKRFLASCRPGIYLKVLKEVKVQTGSNMELSKETKTMSL